MKIVIIVALVAAAMLTGGTSTQAQSIVINKPVVYFLAQAVNLTSSSTSKMTGLYAATLDGAVRQISAPTEDVGTFTVDRSRAQVAYTAYGATPQTGARAVAHLIVRALNTDGVTEGPSTDISVPGFDKITSLSLFVPYIYAIGTTPQNKPQIASIDLQKGQVVKTRAMRLDDTQISIHSTGRWALAANVASSLAVFRLPDLAQVSLPLKGYLGNVASLAPAQEAFQVIVADRPDPAAFTLVIVNLVKLDSVKLNVPHYDKDTQLSVLWSSSGQKVLYGARRTAADGTLTFAAYTVLDLAGGNNVALSYDQGLLTPIAWSPDDAFILFSRSKSGAGAAQGFVVYAVALGQFQDVKTPIIATIGDIAWSPSGHRIALVGGAQSLAQYGVFVTDDTFDASKPLLSAKDPSLSSASLYWTPDSRIILISTPPQTLTADNGSKTLVPGTLRTLDVTSGVFTRLVSDTLSINPDILVR